MIRIQPDNIWTYVVYDRKDGKVFNGLLHRTMRVEVPSAKYLYAYKSGNWDGYAELWENCSDPNANQASVVIRTGLIPRLVGVLEREGIPWTMWKDQRNLPSTILQQTQVPVRDYQHAAISAAFGHTLGAFGWWPRGVLQVATGGGKTEIAVAMFEMNPVPTIFAVHRKDLLIQAKERFEQYGHTVGVLGAGKFYPDPYLNIATLQTLRSIFKDQGSVREAQLQALLHSCQQVFFDECHLMASSLEKGNEFVAVADKFNVPFRWGLTATPFMRDAYDNMLLEGVTGKTLFRVTAKELIDRNYLTAPSVIMKYVPDKLLVPPLDWSRRPSNQEKSKHWREVADKGIKFHFTRTELLVNEIANGPYPMLVLVKTKDQAEFIQNMYTARGLGHLPFLSGKDKAATRRKAVADLRSGALKVVMATTIFDEGVDIPELRKVIIASGGASTGKLIQRVGRVLRTADGKTMAVVIDFRDDHHPTLKKHASARIKTYKEQQFQVTLEGPK
jgi:superfamily II DNA or RNA helicase